MAKSTHTVYKPSSLRQCQNGMLRIRMLRDTHMPSRTTTPLSALPSPFHRICSRGKSLTIVLLLVMVSELGLAATSMRGLGAWQSIQVLLGMPAFYRCFYERVLKRCQCMAATNMPVHATVEVKRIAVNQYAKLRGHTRLYVRTDIVHPVTLKTKDT
jgi:hypothetical protein